MARAALTAAALLTFALLAPAQDAPPIRETPFFRLFVPPGLEDTADFLIEELESARQRARDHWNAPLNESVDVFLWPRESWDALVRENPGLRDALAIARGGGECIVINHAGVRRAGPAALRRTLVHEYTHVYIGRKIARWPADAPVRRLPRWLEEGLAMSVAEEVPWRNTAWLRWLGPSRMIALRNLSEDFPADPALTQQAYTQSADVVEFLVEERGGIVAVMDEIADPARGPAFAASAWAPDVVAGLERRWHETLRLGWRWMLIFTTGGFLWAVVMVVAWLAWLSRRRRARRKIYRWAMEAEGLIPAGLDDEEQDEAVRRLLDEE